MGPATKRRGARGEGLLREAVIIGESQNGGGGTPLPAPVNHGDRQECRAPPLDGPICHAPIKMPRGARRCRVGVENTGGARLRSSSDATHYFFHNTPARLLNRSSKERSREAGNKGVSMVVTFLGNSGDAPFPPEPGQRCQPANPGTVGDRSEYPRLRRDQEEDTV
jgi:hypothetical protein